MPIEKRSVSIERNGLLVHNTRPSQGEAQLYIFEDNEAEIVMSNLKDEAAQ